MPVFKDLFLQDQRSLFQYFSKIRIAVAPQRKVSLNLLVTTMIHVHWMLYWRRSWRNIYGILQDNYALESLYLRQHSNIRASNNQEIAIQFLLVGRTEGARIAKVQLNSRPEECSFTSDVSAWVGALPWILIWKCFKSPTTFFQKSLRLEMDFHLKHLDVDELWVRRIRDS